MHENVDAANHEGVHLTPLAPVRLDAQNAANGVTGEWAAFSYRVHHNMTTPISGASLEQCVETLSNESDLCPFK